MDSIYLAYLKELTGKVFTNKKLEDISLSFKVDTFEICVRYLNKGSSEFINALEIKEVRKGWQVKDIKDSLNKEGVKIDKVKCFSIIYGSEFRLSSLNVTASEKLDSDRWIDGLSKILSPDLFPNYSQKLGFWLFKGFESTKKKEVNLEQMKEYLNKIHCKISIEGLRSEIRNLDPTRDLVNFQKFSTLVTSFLHNQQLFTDIYGRYAIGGSISKEGFESFLSDQGASEKECLDFNRKLEKDKLFFTNVEAVNYLFSEENDIWDTKYEKVYQDMTRPLSHYWIASSHNTYLAGDQWSKDSTSSEAYVRCLRSGCRCIELDCWDGPKDTPVIYHGFTLNAKIPLGEVLEKIRDHAFENSEYPVILSIENHCSVPQQKTMARKFHEIFGRSLVSMPLNSNEDKLPSPEALKGRILIKCKKSRVEDPNKPMGEGKKLTRFGSLRKSLTKKLSVGRRRSSSSSVSSSSSIDSNDTVDQPEFDLSNTFKNGELFIKDDTGKWQPHFCALSEKRLEFASAVKEKRESDSVFTSIPSKHQELHATTTWYHGDLKDVSGASERILQCGENKCFLVRPSRSDADQYTLGFLHNEKVCHIRIQKRLQDGIIYFSLSSDLYHDNLYSCISHYMTNPLPTKEFSIEHLGTPVPQPTKHLNEDWFYGPGGRNEDIGRVRAEQILRKVRQRGAFLVRMSNPDFPPRSFVVSFRLDNIIKHCRLNEDGRLLIVGNQVFESIVELIDYYKTKPFYKQITLSFAATPAVINSIPDDGAIDPIKGYGGYVDTTGLMCRTRAISDYTSTNPDHLSFKKGDIIENIVISDKKDGWWRGDLRTQVDKLFPSNLVEEIEEPLFGNLQQGSVDLGKPSLIPNPSKEKQFPYLLTIENRFTVALKSKEEGESWVEEIKKALNKEKTELKKVESELAKELIRLIVYLPTVPKIKSEVKLQPKYERIFNQIASYDEDSGEKLMMVDPAFYTWLHEITLSRTYPKGRRVDSSNYNPVNFWNLGVQMVSLNYQTPDKSMQLNCGKFKQNGKCGYVLRPEFTFLPNFNPNDEIFALKYIAKGKSPNLNIRIIAARNLVRPGKPILSPLVEVEIFGAEFDNKKFRTPIIVENGLNPYWNFSKALTIINPELALIHFAVLEEDNFEESKILGQATFPLNCIKSGYRSVRLQNCYNEDILATLLVYIKFC